MAGTPHSSTIDLDISTLYDAGVAKFCKTFPVTLATLSDAAQFHWKPGFKGRVMDMLFVTHTPATTASKLSTLTPSIAGTDVTGGVVALNTVACNTRNKEVAGTAVTGANSFTATQTITITGSSTTAFVEGSGELQLVVVNLDMLEAIAGGNFGLRVP